MLCAAFGITLDVRADHAQYLARWLMKEDSKAIFTAAAKAGQAVDYLKGLQPVPSPPLVLDPEPGRPPNLGGQLAVPPIPQR